MRIVFTKNKLPLSVFIRWLFNEPVSHAAFVFDNDKWVFESNLFGTEINWFAHWAKKQQVVLSLNYDIDLKKEDEVFQSMMNENLGKGWDFAGGIWLFFFGLRKKLFGKPMPRRNLWDKPQKLMCHEIFDKLPEWLTGHRGKQLASITPYSMYLLLKGNN